MVDICIQYRTVSIGSLLVNILFVYIAYYEYRVCCDTARQVCDMRPAWTDVSAR